MNRHPKGSNSRKQRFMARDTAIKIRHGEALTKAESKSIQKDPDMRALVRAELKQQGYTPHEIYAKSVGESYRMGMGIDKDGKELPEEKVARDDIRLKGRRHATNEISKLEGLELRAADRDRPPPVVHVHFHAAFDPNNTEYDTRTTENDVNATPRTDTDNPGSTLRKIHNGDLRDQEWKNVPGHGDSEVLVGKTGD